MVEFFNKLRQSVNMLFDIVFIEKNLFLFSKKSESIKHSIKKINNHDHLEIVKAMLGNVDIQVESLKMQRKVLVEFLDVLIELEKNPENLEMQNKVIEYKKNLGML